MTDESNLGLWLWLALIVGINVAWVAMDAWLIRHHHETLSVELREIFINGGWQGILVAVAMSGTIGLMLYHFVFQAIGTK